MDFPLESPRPPRRVAGSTIDRPGNLNLGIGYVKLREHIVRNYTAPPPHASQLASSPSHESQSVCLRVHAVIAAVLVHSWGQ